VENVALQAFKIHSQPTAMPTTITIVFQSHITMLIATAVKKTSTSIT